MMLVLPSTVLMMCMITLAYLSRDSDVVQYPAIHTDYSCSNGTIPN